ncbi:MAG: 50S ribosomal protein L13 [Candidatus Woesearchaeota archaeon]|nr:MAG: 50S ribosomal protein L13 [Candidatus Woesearchaeota archaeon]
MILDATDLILGRFATVVAKKALLGEEVFIVNCEKVVVTGSKKDVLGKYKWYREVGGDALKGPFFPRRSDLVVKRTIRGMLPHKQEKGKKAFKRIRCYYGVPKGLEGKKFETIKEADVSNMQNLKYIYLNEICKELGGK